MGWADELVLQWDKAAPDPELDPDQQVGLDGAVAPDREPARAADLDPDPEPEPEYEGLRDALRPVRREPLRARPSSNGDDESPAEAARRRVRVRPTEDELDEASGNGPVFRTDLAQPATFPRSSPAPPLSMPEPIEPPPRRRRRPLRGR
jgi:hypothetical protein